MPPRIIIAGGRNYNDTERVKNTCENILSSLFTKHSAIECVSGGASGSDRQGEAFVISMQIKHGERWSQTIFPAAWDHFSPKYSAGPLRNAAMSSYATHLIAFWDGRTKGTQSMIKIAQNDGLKTRIMKY
jgi:hypothetical protein